MEGTDVSEAMIEAGKLAYWHADGHKPYMAEVSGIVRAIYVAMERARLREAMRELNDAVPPDASA